ASAKVLDAVAHHGIPRIHFGVGTGELLGLMGEAGADVVGVDWRVPMDEAARRVGPGKALQGNLDPTVLFAGREAVEAKIREVLAQAEGLEGHIFNLGHGVMPNTDPDALTRLVDHVHTARSEERRVGKECRGKWASKDYTNNQYAKEVGWDGDNKDGAFETTRAA